MYKSHDWDYDRPPIGRVYVISPYCIYLDRKNHWKNCLNICKVFGNKTVLFCHKKHANAEAYKNTSYYKWEFQLVLSALCKLTIHAIRGSLLLKHFVYLIYKMNYRSYLADDYINLGEIDHLRVVLHQEFFFECGILEFERQLILFVRFAHLLQKLVKTDWGFQVSALIST